MVSTLLLLLWERFLFTYQRTSWTCLTLRKGILSISSRIFSICSWSLEKNPFLLQFFHIFIGSSHSWYLGRQRSHKVLSVWACICKVGNQVRNISHSLLLAQILSLSCNMCGVIQFFWKVNTNAHWVLFYMDACSSNLKSDVFCNMLGENINSGINWIVCA